MHDWAVKVAVGIVVICNEDGEFKASLPRKFKLCADEINAEFVYCVSCGVELTEGWGKECESKSQQ